MKHVWVIIILFFLAAGCTLHKKFDLYKQPLPVAMKDKLKIDGIYYFRAPKSEHAPCSFFFYGDGFVFVNWGLFGYGYIPDNLNSKEHRHQVYNSSYFWTDPEGQLEEFLNSDLINPNVQYYVAHYLIYGDTLQIQCFDYHRTYPIERNPFNIFCKVLNDTTFQLIKEEAIYKRMGPSYYENGRYLFDSTAIYGFYKTKLRPDSSVCWLRDEEWYIEGLKEREKADSVQKE